MYYRQNKTQKLFVLLKNKYIKSGSRRISQGKPFRINHAFLEIDHFPQGVCAKTCSSAYYGILHSKDLT